MCEIEKDAADPAQPDVGVALFVCPIANGTIACDSQYAVGVDDIPAELKGKVLGFLAAWPAGPATIKPPGAGGPPPT